MLQAIKTSAIIAMHKKIILDTFFPNKKTHLNLQKKILEIFAKHINKKKILLQTENEHPQCELGVLKFA